MLRLQIIILLFSLTIALPASADINSDLIAAIKKGDTVNVITLLDKGADVNSKDEQYGRTALMWATIKGKTAIVKALLDGGADINAKDKNGQFAIKWAALYQFGDIVDLLKKYGAGQLWQIKRISKRIAENKKITAKKDDNPTTSKKNEQKGNTGGLRILNAPSRGPEDAPVFIIEYTDYQCPVCVLVQPRIEALFSSYPGKIRLFVMNNPLNFHLKALPAALAARAAAKQGKFWKMHKLLFENSKKLTEDNFVELARELRLNMTKFNANRRDKKFLAEIMEEQRQALMFGATSTPTFFINGKKVVGAHSLKSFKNIIENELKKQNRGS